MSDNRKFIPQVGLKMPITWNTDNAYRIVRLKGYGNQLFWVIGEYRLSTSVIKNRPGDPFPCVHVRPVKFGYFTNIEIMAVPPEDVIWEIPKATPGKMYARPGFEGRDLIGIGTEDGRVRPIGDPAYVPEEFSSEWKEQ